MRAFGHGEKDSRRRGAALAGRRSYPPGHRGRHPPAGAGFCDTFTAASESIVLPDENGGTATLVNGTYEGDGWTFSWDTIEFNPDPFVAFVGSVTNMAAGALDFTFSTLTPVAPLGTRLIGGSTFVTVADSNFDGVGTLKNVIGFAGFSGTIDGVSVLDLLDPFSISVPFAGGVAGVSDSLGLPGPTIPDGAVVAAIGIIQRFNLTGGDKATFNSTFKVVELVPEPSTGLLLGLGLCGLALRRRR